MGPRARRRATTAAIGVVVLAAGVVAWTHFPSSTGTGAGSDAHSAVALESVMPILGRLAYGMTEKQVVTRVGRPVRAFRDPNGVRCWQYDLGVSSRVQAVAVCFFSGRYSASHSKAHGKWEYQLPKRKTEL